MATGASLDHRGHALGSGSEISSDEKEGIPPSPGLICVLFRNSGSGLSLSAGPRPAAPPGNDNDSTRHEDHATTIESRIGNTGDAVNWLAAPRGTACCDQPDRATCDRESDQRHLHCREIFHSTPVPCTVADLAATSPPPDLWLKEIAPAQNCENGSDTIRRGAKLSRALSHRAETAPGSDRVKSRARAKGVAVTLIYDEASTHLHFQSADR